MEDGGCLVQGQGVWWCEIVKVSGAKAQVGIVMELKGYWQRGE